MVPPQHGAWAFLGLPVLAAATVSPWSPALIPMTIAWIAAYPASYFVLAVVRDRTGRHPDPRRFAGPLATWWSIALLAGATALAARPWLVWVGLVYAASFLVNIAFARRRDERAIVNDLVFVAQCTAMVPVTWAVAVGDRTWTPPPLASAPATLWVLTVAVALLLIGSTLHVKSLIRERADPRYARASRAVALLSLAASAGLAAWWGMPAGLLLVLPFAYFAFRSLRLHDPSMRPARIGIVELIGFVLLVACAALAQALS